MQAKTRMNQIEKITLGAYPTPLMELKNISEELGCHVWIKRDDLCGVALGGNKVRKLEYLLKDAMNRGYDLVMTTGQAQSNHAMLTAACCRKLGLDCVLVLKERGITEAKGNQMLNRLMDVPVVFVDTDDYADIYRKMDEFGENMGRKVYKIVCGGSDGLGSLGYVDCMKEIADSGIRFDHLFCACGSGGTSAGTALGAALYLPGTEVTCVKVDSDPFEEIVPQIMKESADILGLQSNNLPNPNFMDMVGEGYSLVSEEGMDAIRMMMQLEGILLDPCYTGKAFAGLVKKAREGAFKPDDQILFIHTGGAGGVFAHEMEDLEM